MGALPHNWIYRRATTHGDEDSWHGDGVHGGGRWRDACGECLTTSFVSEAPLPAICFEGEAYLYRPVAPPAHCEGRPLYWPEESSLSLAQ